MPGNWPVPFGKELSEKGPSHGHLVGGPLHSVKRTGGNTSTVLRADSTGPRHPWSD
jgi:hypothetical protein